MGLEQSGGVENDVQRLIQDAIIHCRGEKQLFIESKGLLGEFYKTLPPIVREGYLSSYDQEIEELEGLDPATATRKTIDEIEERYRQQRNALLHPAGR